jgi:hypothetical protein
LEFQRDDCAAVTLSGDRVIVLGGRYRKSGEILDLSMWKDGWEDSPGGGALPDTFKWSALPKNMKCKRAGFAAVSLEDDRVVVVGGNDGREHLATAEVGEA